MELKCLDEDDTHVLLGSSNRTFMELKYGQGWCIDSQYESSNRTFMELK